MNNRQEFIRQCRYYKGEDENPFALELDKYEVDKSQLPPPECMHTEYRGINEEDLKKLQYSVNFWGYERYWVEFQMDNREIIKTQEDEYREFVLPRLSIDDGVPISLKALLFNRFAHWYSGYGDVISDFIEWYKHY